MAWGEFKRRNRRYDTIILSYAKFERGMTLANNSKLPFMFVIEIDGTLYWNQLKSCYEVQIAGNHRGQNGDIEPCVFIPFSEFKPV